MWIKKKKSPGSGISGNVDQCEKLEMWRRDAAQNTDVQAPYVMLTVCVCLGK